MFTILHLPIYLSSSYLFEFFIEKLISTFRIGGTNRLAKLNSTKSNQSTSSLKRSLQLKNQLYIVRKEKKKKRKTRKKIKYRSVVPGNLKWHHDFARSLVAAKYAHKY